MDFFELLTEKTLEREQDRVGRSVYLSAGVQRGIEATIEALKDMVVGRHDLGWPDRYHEVAHNWIDDLPDVGLELIALRKEDDK